jgi:Sugar transferases involved in lipopolysaccharide synthesis
MEQKRSLFDIKEGIPVILMIQMFIKRVFDIIASFIFIILLIPFWIVIPILIAADSKGSIIFKQKRVGQFGKLFTIYKFRTMVNNADKLFKKKVDKDGLDNFVFQDKDDPRITRMGKFLRRTSLDELPQLLNVLIGNMSLIGPRPEIKEIADLYDDYQKKRLNVKPGISGLAQVSGRGDLELKDTIEYDITYIKKFSLLLDIYIMFRTVIVIFKSEGAY